MNEVKRALLIYPRYPDTFWSFRHVLRFISKKAAFPPLGLLTVASMLPSPWELKLIDMNVSPLKDHDIREADYVFIGAMLIQEESARDVITRCRDMGKTVVAGGPLFTAMHHEFEEVDHFILGEAENVLPAFLIDLKNGAAESVYRAEEFPDLALTPVPRWDLINMNNYALMSIQYSRGCPFNCEFCDIVAMNGRVPRTKGIGQVIQELEALYARGWRGQVFMVDDNFIGNRKKVKVLLPEIILWIKNRRNPFLFLTEASLDLADDSELLHLMALAGFQRVFIGLETPVEESLEECSKAQNRGKDLVAQVKKIQAHGLEVIGGFIVGFDHDPPSVFEKQIALIQKSGVVTAMVGILNAFPGTRLYQRLGNEKRLLGGGTGNNVDISLNFTPKMEFSALLEGYGRIIKTIYSPREYYGRIITFLEEYRPFYMPRIHAAEVMAFLKSLWYLGVVGGSKKYYWKLMAWTLLKRPRSFPIAIYMAICGLHLQKISDALLSRIPLARQENDCSIT